MVKKGYKQTEVGVVPEDWKILKIKDIGYLTSGESPSHFEFSTGHLPYFKVEQLNNSVKYQIDTPYHTSSSKPIDMGSIIFPKRGAAISTNKFRILAQPSLLDTNIMALTVTNEQVHNEYLFYWFIRKGLWQIADTTSVPQINNKHILPLQFPLPPFAEQERIADALSDIDSFLTALEKQISKEKAIKQGTMQELLTGKRRLPGFSGEWSKCKLGSLGALLKGTGISRNDSNSGNLPAVRYGELYTKHRNYVNSYFSHISKEVASNAQRVYRGDILFTASGETKEDIGKCSAIIYETAAYAGGDILIFRPTAQLDPVFMGTLLNMADARKQRAEQGQGDAVVHIHADALSSISIMIPNIEEQQAIAEILIGMDKEIELLERKLEKYRQVKQGMMQQLLTGKIRLV